MLLPEFIKRTSGKRIIFNEVIIAKVRANFAEFEQSYHLGGINKLEQHL